VNERLHNLNDGCDRVFELWIEDFGVCETGKRGLRKVREGGDNSLMDDGKGATLE